MMKLICPLNSPRYRFSMFPYDDDVRPVLPRYFNILVFYCSHLANKEQALAQTTGQVRCQIFLYCT
jgi:hypothetical protein